MDIQYTVVDNAVLDTTDHHTGHAYLFTAYNGTAHVILGHNKKHNNCASFGGFANPNETLQETICREFSEETLDCVMPISDLINCLSNGIIITRTSSRGKHFTIFCNPEKTFDFSKINNDFQDASQNPNLTPDQKENDYLTMVPVTAIATMLSQYEVLGSTDFSNFIVKDHMNTDVKIRDINVSAYKWIIMQEALLNRNRDISKWKIKFMDDVMNRTIVLFEIETGRPKCRHDILQRVEELGYPRLISDGDKNPSYTYIIETNLCDLSQEKMNEVKEKVESCSFFGTSESS